MFKLDRRWPLVHFVLATSTQMVCLTLLAVCNVALYATNAYWGGNMSIAFVSASFIWALCAVEVIAFLWQLWKVIHADLSPAWVLGVHATWTAAWFAQVCIFFQFSGQFYTLYHDQNFSGRGEFIRFGMRQWMTAAAVLQCFCFCGNVYLMIFSLIILMRQRSRRNTAPDVETTAVTIQAKTDGLHEKPDSSDLAAKVQNDTPAQYPFSPQELPNVAPRLGSNVLVINGVVYRAVPDGEAQEWKSRELSEMIASSPLDKAIEMGTMSMISKSVAGEPKQEEVSSVSGEEIVSPMTT